MSTLSSIYENGKKVLWGASAAGLVYNGFGMIQSAALEWTCSKQDEFAQEQCYPNRWALVGLVSGTALVTTLIYRNFYPEDKDNSIVQMSESFIKTVCALKLSEQVLQQITGSGDLALEDPVKLLTVISSKIMEQLNDQISSDIVSQVKSLISEKGAEIISQLSKMPSTTDRLIYDAAVVLINNPDLFKVSVIVVASYIRYLQLRRPT